MLAYPIATALLLLGQGSSAATAKKKSGTSSRTHHPEKPNFLRKMDGHKNHARRKLSIKEFEAELYGDSKKSAELRQKVIEKSTMVKPPGGGGDKRKLQNYNNNANNANNPYNNNGNYAYDEDGNIQYKYSNNYKDGTDDYFQSNGDWENAFGFDVSQFSLSYHRCAAVRQYDDQIAAMEDTDSVFATQRFAVFRFCPAQTCMGNEDGEEDWECDEDTYGEEYCAALEEYMEQMEENAQNYKQYGNGWNGYNQNGGYDQAQNWMNVNNGNYDGQYDGQYSANSGQYQQQEDEDLVGARGQGCKSNYGEYLMGMEEYLELMLQWQEERFEQYCEYCEACMYDVYEVWLENGGNVNRKLNFEEFKNSDEHRNLGGNDDDGNHQAYYKVCPEYDTCTEYQTICKGGVVDDFSDYFECTEVESNNGRVAYIGPHCSEDGFTISIAVYSDPYCNEYIGDRVDIANFIGEEIDEEEDIYHDYYNSAYGATLNQLQYMNEENVCIPCRKSDLLWVDRANGNRGDYGDDDDDSNTGNGEINELCENVYMVTARCDKHYRSYKSWSRRSNYREALANEDLTCDFIDSIVMGNYNEVGEIIMSNNQMQNGWVGNNMYAQQYVEAASRVSPLQIFGLIASIAAACTLAMWSMTLHKSVGKAEPWRPRRGLRAGAPASSNAAAADIDRQNSGVVMGRSASNTSYYMS